MCTNCYSFSQRLPENDRAVLCWRMNRFTCSVFLLPSLHFSSRVSALQWAERMASCSSLIADWWSVCVHVPPAIVPCSLLSLCECECLSVCVCVRSRFSMDGCLDFDVAWIIITVQPSILLSDLYLILAHFSCSTVASKNLSSTTVLFLLITLQYERSI